LLSDNIRKYRKANNMSQDELAEKLQVTRQSVSLWETGQTQPSLDSIVALSKLFNVSTDDLLMDEQPESAAGVAPKTSEKPKKKNVAVIVICIVAVVIAAAVLVTVIFGHNGGFNLGIGGDTTPTVSSTVNGQTGTAVNTNTPMITPAPTDTPTLAPTPSPTPTLAPTPTPTPKPVKKDIYGYLKDFVVENGTLNGDYCYYSKSADNYGGYISEDFSLFYWGDTDTVEFCLHSVLDDEFSINFYLRVPKTHTGTYKYISSYYYRDTGEPLYEARGTIEAGKFTKKYPLTCSDYTGSSNQQDEFMEMSRVGICDLLECLENFIKVEHIKYSFEDFGFTKF